MSVWWLRGFPDNRLVEAWIANNGKVRFSTRGSINMAESLSMRIRGRKLFLPGSVPRREKPLLLVNEISNAETHRKALGAARQLCQAIRRPVINEPGKVLQTTRDKVSALLQDTNGLSVPRVFSRQADSPRHVLQLAEELTLGFPFLIRESGTHGGETMLLIRDAGDEALLNQLPYDGRDFYLSEYIDYRSDDGLFRKYRFVVVDGEPFLRHMLISAHWMVHASALSEMAKHPQRLEEEIAALRGFDSGLRPRVADALRAIGDALELDYWGADCGLADDGRLIVFEANCNMNVTPNSRADKSRMQPFIGKIIKRFEEMVRNRMSRLA